MENLVCKNAIKSILSKRDIDIYFFLKDKGLQCHLWIKVLNNSIKNDMKTFETVLDALEHEEKLKKSLGMLVLEIVNDPTIKLKLS